MGDGSLYLLEPPDNLLAGLAIESPPNILATKTSEACPGPTPNALANSGTTGTVAPMPKPRIIAGK
jgi:hypothetical protein